MTEFELIYRYFDQQTTAKNSSTASIMVAKGIGDDAAVLDIKANSKLVTCVDTMVQGRHFSEDWDAVNQLAFAIGYKAVAVNVSDLAAMGATPHSILLALALPQRLANKGWLSEFAKGLHHACSQFGMSLIGGDTTRHDKLVISVTANGVMAKGTLPIYRNGACFDDKLQGSERTNGIGNKVYVSGTLGDACYALRHPNNKIGHQLAHRLHMPTPRVKLARALAEQGLSTPSTRTTAMIDVSDGLVQDLSHIAKQSGVRIRLDLDKLPTSEPLQAVELSERLRCQLTGGDDYELLFTLPADVKPPTGKQTNNTKVTCIGEVIGMAEQNDTSGTGQPIKLSYQGKLVTPDDPYPFKEFPDLTGYQHF